MNEVLEAPEPPVVMSAGGTADLIRSRRTIHDFREEPAPPDLVRKALDLARWAPNHHLTEPWRFYLLGPETAAAIARLNAEIVTARQGPEAGAAKLDRWSRIPGWIVVTCANSEDSLRSREDYAACCCAIHSFSLFLWSEGVGVKWTTGAVTRDPRFYDLVWIDSGRGDGGGTRLVRLSGRGPESRAPSARGGLRQPPLSRPPNRSTRYGAGGPLPSRWSSPYPSSTSGVAAIRRGGRKSVRSLDLPRSRGRLMAFAW